MLLRIADTRLRGDVFPDFFFWAFGFVIGFDIGFDIGLAVVGLRGHLAHFARGELQSPQSFIGQLHLAFVLRDFAFT